VCPLVEAAFKWSGQHTIDHCVNKCQQPRVDHNSARPTWIRIMEASKMHGHDRAGQKETKHLFHFTPDKVIKPGWHFLCTSPSAVVTPVATQEWQSAKGKHADRGERERDRLRCLTPGWSHGRSLLQSSHGPSMTRLGQHIMQKSTETMGEKKSCSDFPLD